MKNLKSTALASFALVIALSMAPSQAHAAWGNWGWSSWNWSSWWSNYRPHKPQNKPHHKPYGHQKPHRDAPEPIIGLLAVGAAGLGGVMMRRRSKKKSINS